MITFKTRILSDCTVVEFELEGGVIDPADLGAATVCAPKVDAEKGVVLSGRGPVWLYAALTHEYHPTRFVATHDPRLGGGVVVERHHELAPSVGAIVKI